MSTATEKRFPCRYCGESAASCLEELETNGGYCCASCHNDDDRGIPAAVTHPEEP